MTQSVKAAIDRLLNVFVLCDSPYNRDLLPGLFDAIDNLDAVTRPQEALDVEDELLGQLMLLADGKYDAVTIKRQHAQHLLSVLANRLNTPIPESRKETPMKLSDEQIKYMVDRFLGWKLPEKFNPDGGISFEPLCNKGTIHEFKRDPSGTNLLDSEQAKAMVLYMIEGMPTNAALTHPAPKGTLEALLSLVRRFVDHHTKPAGLDVYTVHNPEAFKEWSKNLDKEADQLIADAQAALQKAGE